MSGGDSNQRASTARQAFGDQNFGFNNLALNPCKSRFSRLWHDGVVRKRVNVLDYERMAETYSQKCREILPEDILASTEIAKSMDRPDFVQALVPRAETLFFPTPQQLPKVHKAMLIVVKGELTLHLDSMDIAVLKQPASFGEACMLGVDEHPLLSVRASAGAQLLKITQDHFFDVCNQFPDLKIMFSAVKAMRPVAEAALNCWHDLPFFSSLQASTIIKVQEKLQNRVFFLGEQILDGNVPPPAFFLLIEGTVRTEVDGCFVEIIEASMRKRDVKYFGEASLLGKDTKGSTGVLAESICLAQLLHRDLFQAVLHETKDFLSLDGLEDVMEGELSWTQHKLAQVSLFRDINCSGEFIAFLARSMEKRVITDQQLIIDADAVTHECTCMFVLLKGSAQVCVKGEVVKVIREGEAFGEKRFLGLVNKRTASVVAQGPCIVQVLHRSVVSRALGDFPEERSRFFAFMNSQMRGLPGVNTDDLADRRMLIANIKKSKFFEGISEEFIQAMFDSGHDRVFLPNEMIIYRGEKGTSMFVMLSGRAGVLDATASKNSSTREMTVVQAIEPGFVFGEMAMLGVQTHRSASVQATTFAFLLEVEQETMFSLLPKHPKVDARLRAAVCHHLWGGVTTRIDELALFKGFCRNLRLLLAMTCTSSVIFPGDKLLKQGKTPRGMLVIDKGMARLDCFGTVLVRWAAGDWLNSTSILGSPRTNLFTVIASTTLHVLTISPEQFSQAILMYEGDQEADRLRRSEQRRYKEVIAVIQRRLMGLTMTYHYLWHAVYEAIMADQILQNFFCSWRRLTAEGQGKKIERLRRFDQHWIKRKREEKKLRKEQEQEVAQHTNIGVRDFDRLLPASVLGELSLSPRSARGRLLRKPLEPYSEELKSPQWRTPPPSDACRPAQRGSRKCFEASPLGKDARTSEPDRSSLPALADSDQCARVSEHVRPRPRPDFIDRFVRNFLAAEEVPNKA